MGKAVKENPGPSSANNAINRSPSKGNRMWTEPMEECLIDSLLHQQSIGNRGENGFTSMAYKNVLMELQNRFHLLLEKENVKNHVKALKANFLECYNLFEPLSAFQWNPESKSWNARPEVWETYIKVKPEAKKWMTKTISHYDKLLELFAREWQSSLSPITTSHKHIRKPKSQSLENLKQKLKEKLKEKSKEKHKESRKGAFFAKAKATKHVDSCRSDSAEGTKRSPNKNEDPYCMVNKRIKYMESALSEGNGNQPSLTLKERTQPSLIEKTQPSSLESGSVTLPAIAGSSVENLVAVPVSANASGAGLPYAPVDWPCPGDVWMWKVGNRVSASGHWVDRHLYPPQNLRDSSGKKITAFNSRKLVEEFIRKEFPEVDVSSFFSLFIWRIRAEGHTAARGLLLIFGLLVFIYINTF